MITVQIRKQGGAAVMTIPSDVMKLLHCEIGETLELDVEKDSLVVRPLHHSARKRYSLDELLQGVTVRAMRKIKQDTAWFRKGGKVGRELT